MHSGLVFNIQRYSIHDGPGIRTTVFLKGCPLRCWWCHNPEGMSPQAELVVADGRCTVCGQCREACEQHGAGPVAGDFAAAPPVNCIRCGACAEACPSQARQLLGRNMTSAEVVAEIERDRVFYDDTDGGATFSGGEPFFQAPFLVEVLEACRRRDIHTAVDTTGFVDPETLLAAARWTDLFLYDIKILDDDRHQRYTGVSNATILENLRLLGREHGNIWVRVPVVPGINDAPSDLEATVRFAATMPGVKQVNLLTYHPTGAYKFIRLGKPNPLEHVRPADAALFSAAADRLRGLGVPIVVGG